jgi:hypothetical protein
LGWLCASELTTAIIRPPTKTTVKDFFIEILLLSYRENMFIAPQNFSFHEVVLPAAHLVKMISPSSYRCQTAS